MDSVKSSMFIGVRETQKHRMGRVGRDPVGHLIKQGHPRAHCRELFRMVHFTDPAFSSGPTLFFCFPFVIDVFEESPFVVLDILVQF